MADATWREMITGRQLFTEDAFVERSTYIERVDDDLVFRDAALDYTITLSELAAGAAKAQVVTVAKSGGDFDTIQDAMTSINDSSSTNPYAIVIYPGVYDVGTSGIEAKKYVSLIGISRDACIIRGAIERPAGTPALLRWTSTNAQGVTVANLTLLNNHEFVLSSSEAARVIYSNSPGWTVDPLVINNCRIISKGKNAIQINGGDGTTTAARVFVLDSYIEAVYFTINTLTDDKSDVVIRNCDVVMTEDFDYHSAVDIGNAASRCWIQGVRFIHTKPSTSRGNPVLGGTSGNAATYYISDCLALEGYKYMAIRPPSAGQTMVIYGDIVMREWTAREYVRSRLGSTTWNGWTRTGGNWNIKENLTVGGNLTAQGSATIGGNVNMIGPDDHVLIKLGAEGDEHGLYGVIELGNDNYGLTGSLTVAADDTGDLTASAKINATQFNGSGAGLTNVPDTALTSNIARLNTAQTWTGVQTTRNQLINERLSNTAGTAAQMDLRRARESGGAAANVIVGDTLLDFRGFGYHTGTYKAAGRIQCKVSGTPSSTAMPGKWEFLTTPAGSVTPALALTLNPDKSAKFEGVVQTGGYKSSDGTAGITTTIHYLDIDSNPRQASFKDGLLVSDAEIY